MSLHTSLRAINELVTNISAGYDTSVTAPIDRNEPQSQQTIDALGAIATSLRDASKQLQLLHGHAWAEESTALNRAAPIHTLPLEFLYDVFCNLAGDRSIPFDGTYSSDIVSRRERNAWLRVTGVCRHWRAVAVRQPNLWNVIDYGTSSRAALDSVFNTQWLRRARTTPLFIFVNALEALGDDTLRELASRVNQIQRIRFFNISSPNKLTIFGAPAPILDRLWIHSEDSTALPTLFADEIPTLRILTLIKFVSLSGNNFRNLVRLNLRSQRFTNDDDFMRVMRILQSSSHFRHLHAEYCGRPDDLGDAEREPGGVDYPIEPFPFPSLATIQLDQCGPSFIGGVLQRIELHPDQSVRIRVDLDSRYLLKLPTAFPSSYQSRLYPLQQRATELQIAVHHGKSDFDFHLASPTSALGISVAHSVYGPGFDGNSAEIFTFLPDLFPFPSLVTLRLTEDAPSVLPSWKDWRDLFGALTSLTTLMVNLSSIHMEEYRWLQALTDIDLGDKPYPVPLLHTLRLSPPAGDGLCTLAAVVTNRHANGHMLQTLDIFDDDLSADYGLEEPDDESAVATFRRWVAEKGTFQKYVREVNIIVVDEFPDLPSLPEYLDAT